MVKLADLYAKLAALGNATGAERNDVLSAIAKLGGTPVPVPSSDGTRGVTVTDSTGAVWTLGPGPYPATLRNGVNAGGGWGTIYVYHGGKVHTTNTGAWYVWTGSAWASAAAPPVAPAPPAPFTWTLPDPIDVPVGQTLNLGQYASRPAKWSMTAVPFATLSQTGLLRGVSAGSADVDITADDA